MFSLGYGSGTMVENQPVSLQYTDLGQQKLQRCGFCVWGTSQPTI